MSAFEKTIGVGPAQIEMKDVGMDGDPILRVTDTEGAELFLSPDDVRAMKVVFDAWLAQVGK